MKRIVVVARKEELKRIREIAEKYVYAEEEVGGLIRVTIYLPDGELDSFIPKLQEAVDLRRRDTLIEVSSPDFVISSVLKRKEKGTSVEKEPVEKLLAYSKKYTRFDWGKTGLTVIAGIIALIGLFMNNVPIIIGAMLLSPLLGPIYAFVIHIALGRSRDAWMSLLNFLLMLILVIFTSLLSTLIISLFMPLSLTPEILLRFDTNPIYILVAILLGFAAIAAYVKGLSESIAGIAIAAALIPPIVVSGIALAIYPSEAMKPIVLSLENIIGLMFGGLLAILVLRIEPRRYYERAKAKEMLFRIYLTFAILLALMLIISLTL